MERTAAAVYFIRFGRRPCGAAAAQRLHVMLHKRAPSETQWRIAGVICLMLCYGVLFLWHERPGQLYKYQHAGREYSLRADWGRLLVTRWSLQAGLNVLWNVPLWPFILLTAAPPVVILWKFGAYRPKQPHGFPVAEQGGRREPGGGAAQHNPPMQRTGDDGNL